MTPQKIIYIKRPPLSVGRRNPFQLSSPSDNQQFIEEMEESNYNNNNDELSQFLSINVVQISVDEIKKRITEAGEYLKFLEVTADTIKSRLPSFTTTNLSTWRRRIFPTNVYLPSLQVIKISIQNKPRSYKKTLKSLLFFMGGKSKLNRLWTATRDIETVDLQIRRETIIMFDKRTKELVVNRFLLIINADSYLLAARGKEGNGLKKFACFYNTITLENLERHSSLTELILNNCYINYTSNPDKLTSVLSSFRNLETLIIDCGRENNVCIDLETLLCKATKLKLLIIGHCEVKMLSGFKNLKDSFVGKKVTFFNCLFQDEDLKDKKNLEISIDASGELSDMETTTWNSAEAIKHLKYRPKDDRKYYFLFQMDKFSSYGNHYFHFPKSDENSHNDVDCEKEVAPDGIIPNSQEQHNYVASTCRHRQNHAMQYAQIPPASSASLNSSELSDVSDLIQLGSSEADASNFPSSSSCEPNSELGKSAYTKMGSKNVEELVDSLDGAGLSTFVAHQSSGIVEPNSELGKSVSQRLSDYLRALHAKDEHFTHFIQPHLVELYENTSYGKLIFCLKQYGVLIEYDARQILAIPDWDTLRRGDAVYTAIKKQGETAIPKLIKALEESGNDNVIKSFDKWLRDVKPVPF